MNDVPRSTAEIDAVALANDVQKPGFAADQLVSCTACSRKNPPNRATCIYCAAELELVDLSTVPALIEVPESWEKGFNVVALPQLTRRGDLEEAGRLLGRDVESLQLLIETTIPLPLARVKTAAAAEKIVEYLNKAGWQCTVVSDEDLSIDQIPLRLGALGFGPTAATLRMFNTGEVLDAAYPDISLLVSGSLVISRVDSHEKKKSRGRSQAIGESTSTSREPIMDLYLRHDKRTFRINATGFDFSCLGPEKSLTVTTNIIKLANELAGRSPEMMLNLDYDRSRAFLTPVWDVEEQRNPLGIKRTGFGQKAFATASTTSNREQFTRYSRLMMHLHEKQQEQF
jgi:hypothetical protein